MTKIGIIGAGPAGLTLARLLTSKPGFEVTIFEAKSRIGGKSESILEGGVLSELGTCYTTTAYKNLHKWMVECGINLRPMTRQKFDDREFEEYVKDGEGAPTIIQGARYVYARYRLMRKLEARPEDPKVLAEAAMIAEDWLAQKRLPKITRLFHRTYVNLGYGFLNETSISQVMRWTDLDLIWSGLRKKLQMPVEGWSTFWERFSKDLDVRLSTPVRQVVRGDGPPIIVTDEGLHHFDAIVCAIPLDDFSYLTDPTPNESTVLNGTEWSSFTTTLFSASDWFTEDQTQSYSKGLVSGAERGQLISARREGYSEDLGGNLYLSGQISGTLSAKELEEILIADVKAQGAKIGGILHQRRWKYHNHQKPDAIKAGLLKTMKDMQGEQSTFYTGTTFAHEAVSHITNLNVQLAHEMHRAALASKGMSK